MKPNFALSLSFDGVALYHRTSSGWLTVGTASLEDPDLAERMRVLRRTASELEPRGVSTKLIIPNSEILYREVAAPGPGQHSRELQVRQSLEGMTPYAVEDLAWDYRAAGDHARVAVVAKETLAEAESFAIDHRFNPVSYVAVPDGTWFEGEPFFGQTAHASTFLGRREAVERDTAPVRTSGEIRHASPEQEARPVVETSESEPVITSPLREPAIAATRDDPAPMAQAVAEPSAAKPPEAPAAKKAPAKPKAPARAPAGHSLFDRPAAKPVVKPEAEAETAPAQGKARVPSVTPAFSTRRTADPAGGSLSAAPALERAAPRIGIAALAPPDPVAPPEAPASRQNGYYSNGKSAPQTDADPAQQGRLDALKSKFAFDLPRMKTGALAAGVAPMLERTRKMARKAVERRPKDPTPAKREAEALTIFSQRGKEPRKASARTGMMLTLVLAAVMVLVALGSLFLTGTGTDPETPLASAPAPALPIEDAAGRPDTAALTPDRPEDLVLAPEALDGDAIAAIDPAEGLDIPLPDVPAEPEPELAPKAEIATPAPVVRPPEQALTPEMAEARYAATGIWQLAPDPIAPPVSQSLDDLYVASIDPVVTSEDAFALPEAPGRAGDTAPASQLAPAPFGTAFEFDDRGLVVATPDGALSPEGIEVFSGAPSVVPGPRPEGLAPATGAQQGAEPTGDGETLLDAPDTLPRLRPPARPEDLVEGNERARLGGRTLTELAAFRPTLRPEGLATAPLSEDTAEAPRPEDSLPVTENAIAASVLPRQRPANFSDVVSAARAAETVQTASLDTTELDEPDPPAANIAAAQIPAAPVRADVARTATVSNAISLGQLNLIGVYGAASDRRALLRLSSGRYVKVKIGDKVDGGQVAAIGSDELRLIKNGRNVTLTLPRG
ncbi:hypothetical protein [Anianabacter salinae]|uniref:hypothetical protein n=1 Tax=Anianabacter salinae TaxID=2851023 RepID=UPI00225DE267|nr:hypothetical protein [Anianabacter salinae]MBV0911611.1 hypothetical protein [Anianabacter salinae]